MLQEVLTMLKVSDIPDQVLHNIAGSYHRRLASTDTESQPAEERDFQRTVYLRTALEWLAHWLNDRDAPAAVPDVLPRSRLIRIDTVSNTVRIECVDKVGRETLSGLVPFDGTTAGLFSALAAAQTGGG